MKKFLVVLLISLFCFIPVDAKEVKYKIVSGDIETVGSEVCFDTECFYVIGNDGNNVKFLAKYNLYVGSEYNNGTLIEYGKDATGKQDENMLGNLFKTGVPSKGVTAFSDDSKKGENYSDYTGSIVEGYVKNYKNILKNIGIVITDARLITLDELKELGCGEGFNTMTCGGAPKWVYSTSYWTQTGFNNSVYAIYSYNDLHMERCISYSSFGVRPVIEVPVGYFGGVYVGSVKRFISSDGVISKDDNNVDLIFNDLGQEVKYETIIYNDSDSVMYVNDISIDDVDEEFIGVRLDSKSDNMMIEPNGSSLVTFYVNTLKQEGAGRNFNDNVKINFKISDKNLNPNTFSNLLEVLILVIALGGTIYFIKKKNKKKINTLIMIGIVSLLGITYVSAKDYEIITIFGNVKYVSQNIIETTGTSLNGKKADYTNSKDVWAYYDKVKSVEVKSLIEKPKKYFKEFDLTENKSGRVVGYLIENEDEDTPYDLVIMSNGVIAANSDSSFMFSFPNVEKVEGLSNVDFRGATTMQGMFIGNEKLVSVNIKSIEMDNTANTSFMFYDCVNIEHTKDDFDLTNVSDTTMMFIPYLYNEVKNGSKNDSSLVYHSGSGSGKYFINSTKDDKFPIYFYRGNITNNNVIFGNFCWKMVRTTNTGGIKLIYNGSPAVDGSCNNTGENSIVGKTRLTSLAPYLHNGSYMYGNNTSTISTDGGSWSANFIYTKKLSGTSYYYSKEIEFSNGKYILKDPKLYSYDDMYNDLGGYYTYFGTSPSSSDDFINYVLFTDSTTVYYYQLFNGAYGNFNKTFYKNYKVNDDGSFKLFDPVSISRKDYYNGKYSDFIGYYICAGTEEADKCERLLNIKTTDKTSAQCSGRSNYIYGKNYKYENGEYTLLDTKQIIHGDGTDYTSIYDYSFTCKNFNGKCTYLYYVVQVTQKTFYYIILSDGVNVEQEISSLYSNNKNSLLKTAVDNWYKNNLRNYTNMLEDTVWYNDRTFTDGKLASINNKSNVSNKFSTYHRLYTLKQDPSLEYKDRDDMFTVDSANGNGKLTYPVGLITGDELTLAASGPVRYNTKNYLKIGTEWWTMSPGYASGSYLYTGYVHSKGYLGFKDTYNSYGIRPMVSLKHGVLYSNGDGTVNNPYVIE